MACADRILNKLTTRRRAFLKKMTAKNIVVAFIARWTSLLLHALNGISRNSKLQCSRNRSGFDLGAV